MRVLAGICCVKASMKRFLGSSIIIYSILMILMIRKPKAAIKAPISGV